MFDRREKPSTGAKVLSFFWPPMGWRRTVTYMLHRLGRMPGSSYSIAAGFACGAAVSFTPFVGLHFVLGGCIAWIIRANVLSAIIGTAVGNPWTFPFIWAWLHKTGTMITDVTMTKALRTEDFGELFGHILEASISFDVQYLLDSAAPIFVPMLLSSIPTGFVVWWAFYLPLKYVIQRYQERRFRKYLDQLATAKEETP